jgi:hypothetical protein
MLIFESNGIIYTMKTKQKADRRPGHLGHRFWLGCLTLLLGLPVLFYYGYCWGLWGRHSLLLQYLFQCNCPPTSEEARYPEDVDVIVSACHNTSSLLSPSGRFLYVQAAASSHVPGYFWDLQNNDKKPFFIPPDGTKDFLTDDLLFLSLEYGHDYEGGEYILDRTTGKQYPIRFFVYLREDAYINRELNLDALADSLREVQDVFLIGGQTIVALASDFQTNPEHNFYIDRPSFPGYDENRAAQFLQQNNIEYHSVPDRFPDEVLSRDKRFIARADGIYLVETNQKIVDGYSTSKYYRSYSGKYFSVRGWTYDSSAVIYSKFLKPCLIEVELPFIDTVECYLAVPQPLLKLNVPEEYLLSQETP